jgi:2-hydroxychromene-2-carboxylate isomerase
MIFDQSIALAEKIGIPVEIRPVMPMVMRGVPAPGAKGIYIMLDALREAQHLGVPFGDMYDPIGKPVERGFSLFPFADERGRGAEFISSFLRAAFAEGRVTGSDEGLKQVVEDAGLNWDEAKHVVDNEAWRDGLEANRQEMYDGLGAWGVPSYRLRSLNAGPEGIKETRGEPDVSVWGQDRLWLIAAEIRRRLAD